MHDDIDALRTEVAELRDALVKLLPLAFTIATASQDAAEATRDLYRTLKSAAPRQYSETFWDVAAPLLRAVAQRAAHDNPQDAELQAFLAGLGTRH